MVYFRNNIINEKDSVKNKIKIFEEFKTKFNKQNQEKNLELKNLSGKYDIPIIIIIRFLVKKIVE